MIDFYNVQFYNQGSTPYNTYTELFTTSSGWCTGTSVNEIIARGVPSNKLVVGKPASPADAANTGYMDSATLGAAVAQAYTNLGWYAGVMFWQYPSDLTGALISASATNLTTKCLADKKCIAATTTTTIPPTINVTTTPVTTTPVTTTPVTTTPNVTTTPTTTTNTSTAGRTVVNYPVRFTYVDKINGWWPPATIAAGLGVPGYAQDTPYNYVALAFWSCAGTAMDIALVWANAGTYFNGGPFGSDSASIQKTLKDKYAAAGVKILVSAFGATEFPTSLGLDPVTCATKLANFVLDNNLDGADIDWEDNDAMNAGTGEQWLIDFTKKLRALLPTQIITHAPQAPYFKK